MNKRPINFWIIAIAGIAAFGWMIAELVRVLYELRQSSGLGVILSDGVVQHKVGELMVAVPFVAILALINLWSSGRVRTLIRRTAAVMVIGGVLNGLAWFSLRDELPAGAFLRLWCLVIFGFGLIGPWLLTLMAKQVSMKR